MDHDKPLTRYLTTEEVWAGLMWRLGLLCSGILLLLVTPLTVAGAVVYAVTGKYWAALGTTGTAILFIVVWRRLGIMHKNILEREEITARSRGYRGPTE